MTTTNQVPGSTATPPWTAAQRFAAVFGVIYLAVGLAGFAVTGTASFTGHTHDTLLIFAVNPLHNVVHVAMALVWLGCCAWHRAARVANLGLGVVLGLVTVLGF